MPFDFKKEYRELYAAKAVPTIVTVPKAHFLSVLGKGDPNEEGGAYKASIEVLYAVAYTIKMSKLGDYRMEGYFDFVVPPLEGFWWMEGMEEIDVSDKSKFCWRSVLRVPEFVTDAEFRWAVEAVETKKKLDCSKVELCEIEEGLCSQMLHIGPFDEQCASIDKMQAFAEDKGYVFDLSETRRHHEIYLSDARKVEPAKWRTILRHPIRIKG